MNYKRNILYFFISIILPLLLHQCTDKNDRTKIEDMKSPQDYSIEPKYYTSENEGRWVSKSDTHTPLVTFSKKDKNAIEVRVPLQPRKKGRHYIEAIALMQGERQIAIKKFKFSLSEARAKFKLPNPDKGDYWISAKCNLHDMWKAKVPNK